MQPTDRIPIGFSSPEPDFARLVAMLGHYDFRVYVSETAYVDVGAGSLGLLKRLTLLPGGFSGSLGKIGRFCEFSETTKVIVHGEHDNDRVVNVTFGGSPLLKGRNKTAEKPYEPFSIGNAVVASEGVTILGGVSIGDGVVIGASATVTKDLEAHAIYVGVPARKIRDRPRGASWWDFDMAYLFSNLENIEAVAVTPTAEHTYRRPVPPFVLKTSPSLEILGHLVDDQVVPFSQMPATVKDYVIQAMTSPSPYWIADCWAIPSS